MWCSKTSLQFIPVLPSISHLKPSFTPQVVKNLVRETEASSQEMLAALLDRLRGSIQLPECLRVVAHLRRLAPFSETKLRQMYALPKKSETPSYP